MVNCLFVGVWVWARAGLVRRPSCAWNAPKERPLAVKLEMLLQLMFHQFDFLVGNMDGHFTPADLVKVYRRNIGGR